MEASENGHLKFEFFDVTADVGYIAYGQSLHEAFENASIAMFEVITDTSTILPGVEKKIHLEAEDECALLYDWLSELLFLHDTEYLVFSKFNIKLNTECNDEKRFIIDALAFGQEFDPSIHERRSEVKAVTYHMMNIKFEDYYKVQVILDL
ncbi:MAG: archease [Methanobacterium sp.]|nr:archease [Methanobacterium sp.]